MGNTESIASKKYFTIERTVAAECDYLPETAEQIIQMGVYSGPHDDKNPLSRQGIRIGREDILGLKHFVEHAGAIEYHFEKDTQLIVFKRDADVCYRLKNPVLDVTRTINPVVVKNFKSIGMRDASREIDRLEAIMR